MINLNDIIEANKREAIDILKQFKGNRFDIVLCEPYMNDHSPRFIGFYRDYSPSFYCHYTNQETGENFNIVVYADKIRLNSKFEIEVYSEDLNKWFNVDKNAVYNTQNDIYEYIREIYDSIIKDENNKIPNIWYYKRANKYSLKNINDFLLKHCKEDDILVIDRSQYEDFDTIIFTLGKLDEIYMTDEFINIPSKNHYNKYMNCSWEETDFMIEKYEVIRKATEEEIAFFNKSK